MKTALVTGAGRGLGLEWVEQLLGQGYQVVATARDPTAETLVCLAEAHGQRLVRVPLDLSDTRSMRAIYDRVRAHVTHLDLLVHNAGVDPRTPSATQFGSLQAEVLLGVLQLNAVAPVLLTQSLLRLLKKSKGGRVVGISSRLGSIAGKKRGGKYGYCTSKAALNMLFRGMAVDLLPFGIIAVLLDPGWVRTGIGGPRATLTPEESVCDMLRVVASLNASSAGRFLGRDGRAIAW